MFKKNKIRVPNVPYDADIHKAVIKSSICTGEQVIGFKDIRTNKFTDVMRIKDDKDVEAFKKKYNITNVTKEY